jgi:hypothetical protein
MQSKSRQLLATLVADQQPLLALAAHVADGYVGSAGLRNPPLATPSSAASWRLRAAEPPIGDGPGLAG